ncbi:TonB-dependent receptor, partial [uncultured Flavobacterium sp.]|uniref:TonB-dependent receptor domain-containing protein n=1 Tax=uncultured Flavobacterium sp. TaxID=165435 RepID=UPI002594A781
KYQNNMNKNLYPNTTQVPNIIIDNMSKFSNTELRILLLVVRKTIGWHKETDYLTYNQIQSISGIKSNKSVSVAVNNLVDRGFVSRVSKSGKSLDPVPRGYRDSIFYTLSKKISQIIAKEFEANSCKNYTSTDVKITSNKTNSYKTNKTNGDTISDKNVDNLGITQKKGLTPLKEYLTDLKFKRYIVDQEIHKETGSIDIVRKMDIVTPHQAYGFEVVAKLKLGMDYYINEKNTLSAYTNQSFTYGSGTGLTTVVYDDAITNRNTTQLFRSNGNNKNQTYDMVFKHDFEKKDENFELQLNYSHTVNDENTVYNETISNPTESFERTNLVKGTTDYFQMNADYVNPISETLKLELGVETRIQNSGNQFNDINPSFTSANNSFDFGRNIYSAYANLGKQIGKWSGQLGVRLEYFDLDANFAIEETNPAFSDTQNISDDLFTAYPSAFFTYTANDKNSFNFNYSRRVDRPSIGQISPIREWTTPLMESRGNPALAPQFTNSFEANYTRTTKIGSITSGVFYRSISDEISRTVYNDPNNVNRNILSYANFDNNNAYGIESSANLKFTKWWSANASADIYFKTAKGTIQNANTNALENAEVDVTTFNARINNSFTATKDLRFQLFGMYRGKDKGLQYDRKAMYKMDFGATYNILKGKGTITARYNDVFENMHFAFDGKIPYRQQGAFYWESQTFYVGINYIFGGGKNRALARKQRDANETQGGGGMF